MKATEDTEVNDDVGDDVVGVTDEAEAAITNVLHYG